MAKRIIAVEDSPNLQKILRLIFSETEFEFDLCENYEQLTQQFKLSEYHLLLLDFSISSNVDGYSLCRTIKRDYPSLKVILMFGTFDAPDKDKLSYAGADDHIFKPFDSEKLLKLCQKLTSDNPSQTQTFSRTDLNISSSQAHVPDVLFNEEITETDPSWGNLEVPSIIGESRSERMSDEVEEADSHTEFHADPSDALFERTEVFDLEAKQADASQNIQKMNQIIGKEKIEDLWTFDENSEVRTAPVQSQKAIVNREHYFEHVDQNVLKKELMSEFKRTLIYEIKEEVFKQLWNSLKQDFMDKKASLIQKVSKEAVSHSVCFYP